METKISGELECNELLVVAQVLFFSGKKKEKENTIMDRVTIDSLFMCINEKTEKHQTIGPLSIIGCLDL